MKSSLAAKPDQKFELDSLSRSRAPVIMSKDQTSTSPIPMALAADPSFTVYYGDLRGAVPFTWESTPGTPKHPSTVSNGGPESDPSIRLLIPPLTPPPSYYHHHGADVTTTKFNKPLLRSRLNLSRFMLRGAAKMKALPQYLRRTPTVTAASIISSPSLSSASNYSSSFSGSWTSSTTTRTSSASVEEGQRRRRFSSSGSSLDIDHDEAEGAAANREGSTTSPIKFSRFCFLLARGRNVKYSTRE